MVFEKITTIPKLPELDGFGTLIEISGERGKFCSVLSVDVLAINITLAS